MNQTEIALSVLLVAVIIFNVWLFISDRRSKYHKK